MFPPKQYIGRTTHGAIDYDCLDLVRNGQLRAQFPDAHAAHKHHHHYHDHGHQHKVKTEMLPEPGKPVRKTGNDSSFFSGGWIFHRDDCFDYWKLEEILNRIEGVSRIKGVIRIGHAWVLFNRVQNEHDFDKVAYRRDSRIEIISPRELNWEELERDMAACLISNSG